MGPQVPPAPPVLWALGGLALLLWLWALCTACHRYVWPGAGRVGGGFGGGRGSEGLLGRGSEAGTSAPINTPLAPRKRAQRQQPPGRVMQAEALLLRRHPLCTLSKSDTRLHELHRGPGGCRGEPRWERRGRGRGLHPQRAHCPPVTSVLTPPLVPRPVSMDVQRPQWLEVSRGTSRPLVAFSPREPPFSPAAASPSIGPEATYSNVGLAAVPRASLAASPAVWAGARLTSSRASPGPEPRPEVAEYACIRRLKGAAQGPQGLGQGTAAPTPAVEVDILYSKVRKPKKRDPGTAADQLDPKGSDAVLAVGSDQSHETLPLGGLGKDDGLLENVYESIQDMGAQGAWNPLLRPEGTCAGLGGSRLPQPQPRRSLHGPTC
uniref:Lck interacting transmembrane adaptor 1 n=1 Tax=Canis lupus familiaris TaxID=9615 RepID=A0A8P0P240_CANLF